MNRLYIQQISISLVAKNNVRILPGHTGVVSAALKTGKSTFTPRNTIMGKDVAYVRPFDKTLPLRPIKIEFENKCCLEIHNSSDSTVKFLFGNVIAYFDVRSKDLVQANNSKHFPIDKYFHDRVTPATLSPKLLAYNKPSDPSEMPRISTCTDTITDNTNVPTKDDKYPWLDPDDKQRHMTDAKILRHKLNLEDSLLDDKGKEEFLMKTDNFHNVFSLRDKIGTCPFIEVHLKLKGETPYPMREEQKKVIQKEMDRLEHLGIIQKGLMNYSSPVVLDKRKIRICTEYVVIFVYFMRNYLRSTMHFL